MRKFAAAITASAAIGLAAFAQQQNAHQQNPPSNPNQPANQQPANQDRHQPRLTERVSGDKDGMTAREAAEMFRAGKHSLADSIAVAERKTGGKAVSAKCCMKSEAELAAMRIDSPKPQAKSPGQPPNPEQAHGIDPQSDPKRDEVRVSGSEKGPVCVVTCLVDDNRLTEVVVCSKSSEVVAQRPINAVGQHLE